MRPSVVAHRGSSEAEAEHTLGAYLKALDEGADGLECDVRLTADGHLVCVHDRDLRRVANSDGVVSTMKLAQLDELDFASWKNPWADLDDEAPELDADQTKVLTLQRLLETVADYDRRVELAIETKHPTRYAGLVERRLVEMLDSFGWAGHGSPARVMSFSWVALSRVRRHAPDLDIVLLMYRPYSWQLSKSVSDEPWIAGPDIALLRARPQLASKMHKAGRRIHSWVVNTPEDVELCRELGVEAVITDKPTMARRVLEPPPASESSA